MSEVTRVYLVRHGETEWNQNRPSYCGWTDIALNAKGMAQAQALGRRFRDEKITAIICSDLARARVTGETIHAACPDAALGIDPRFRELNYGAWEGLTPEQLEVEDRDRFRSWKADPVHTPTPEGETLSQVMDRARPALKEWMIRRRGESIVIVSHKTTVRGLLCAALGIPLADYTRILQQNAAINELKFRGDSAHIALVNDTCHLPGDLCSPAI